jgi:protein gp37
MKWWDVSWNPVVGCTPASPGCDNCYAKRLHDQRHRACADGKRIPLCYDEPFEHVRLFDTRLDAPLRWRKPRRIFVGSMTDLFHPDVPFRFLDRVFATMALASQHTFILLTKRPGLMRAYIKGVQGVSIDSERDFALFDAWRAVHGEHYGQQPWPLPNVWLGVTAETQPMADERIPILLDTPAAKRFVSIEPQLGPVDVYGGDPDPRLGGIEAGPGLSLVQYWTRDGRGPYPGLDWVICGGETSPHARPMHPEWARSLRDQCSAAGVPFFFKQWGEWGHCGNKPSGTPGKYAFGGSDHAPNLLVQVDQFPRQIDLFGAKVLLERIGSRRAGRLLDGREHNDIPEVRHA